MPRSHANSTWARDCCGAGSRPWPPRATRPSRARGTCRPSRRNSVACGPRTSGCAPSETSWNCDGLLRQGVGVRYRFIQAHRDRWPVRLMCEVLGVSPGGFYGRRRRPLNDGQQRREALVAGIGAIHREVKARYGSPRMHAELLTRGESCCVNTVVRLMRQHGISAKTTRKFRCTTDSKHDRPVAANLVDRQFEPGRPTGPGRPTSPTSRRVRAGCTWRPWRTCIRGGSSAGRWTNGSTAAWSSMPSRWRSRGGCPDPTWWPTRIEAASTRASTTSGPGRPRDQLQHEPPGELLGRRADGELPRLVDEGADPP